MGDMMDKCLEYADKLGLSEEQINKIKPIHREMQKNRRDTWPTLRLHKSR